MRLIRLLAAMVAGAATLVLPRRRPGRLRADRGRAALRLAARGGARYAASAPRLFTAAGEQRQQLREDLALQTAEDVAATLGAMKGVMMKIGQMASYVDDALAPAVRHTLARLQEQRPADEPGAGRDGRRGRTRRAAGTRVRPLGSAADSRRLDRAGPPSRPAVGHRPRAASQPPEAWWWARA